MDDLPLTRVTLNQRRSAVYGAKKGLKTHPEIIYVFDIQTVRDELVIDGWGYERVIF